MLGMSQDSPASFKYSNCLFFFFVFFYVKARYQKEEQWDETYRYNQVFLPFL